MLVMVNAVSEVIWDTIAGSIWGVGVSAQTVGVSALARNLLHFEATSQMKQFDMLPPTNVQLPSPLTSIVGATSTDWPLLPPSAATSSTLSKNGFQSIIEKKECRR